jgi:hypothetical protein
MVAIHDQFNNVVVNELPLCLFAFCHSPMKNRLLEYDEHHHVMPWRLRCAPNSSESCTDNLDEENDEWLQIP